MTLKEYFGTNIEFSEEEDLQTAIKALILAEGLDGGELDTLRAAYSIGLLESGDTPSKSGRGTLLSKGILTQTCHKGGDYTFSVTYPLGFNVVRALKVRKDV